MKTNKIFDYFVPWILWYKYVIIDTKIYKIWRCRKLKIKFMNLKIISNEIINYINKNLWTNCQRKQRVRSQNTEWWISVILLLCIRKRDIIYYLGIWLGGRRSIFRHSNGAATLFQREPTTHQKKEARLWRIDQVFIAMHLVETRANVDREFLMRALLRFRLYNLKPFFLSVKELLTGKVKQNVGKDKRSIRFEEVTFLENKIPE